MIFFPFFYFINQFSLDFSWNGRSSLGVSFRQLFLPISEPSFILVNSSEALCFYTFLSTWTKKKAQHLAGLRTREKELSGKKGNPGGGGGGGGELKRLKGLRRLRRQRQRQAEEVRQDVTTLAPCAGLLLYFSLIDEVLFLGNLFF